MTNDVRDFIKLMKFIFTKKGKDEFVEDCKEIAKTHFEEKEVQIIEIIKQFYNPTVNRTNAISLDEFSQFLKKEFSIYAPTKIVYFAFKKLNYDFILIRNTNNELKINVFVNNKDK